MAEGALVAGPPGPGGTAAPRGAARVVRAGGAGRIGGLIRGEGGLNDGIATPFVWIASGGAGTAAHEVMTGPAIALAELALGLLIGAVVGGAGGWLVGVARRRGWASDGFAGSAVLGLAVCAYAAAVALHGNGFIAAFAGGPPLRPAGGQGRTRPGP